MSTVWIIIKGLAICFRKDRAWWTRFVCDDTHVLMLEPIDATGNPIFPPMPLKSARSIDVAIAGGIPQKVTESPDFGMVFDMTGLYCHRKGVKPAVPGRGVRSVDMRIPDAGDSNAVFCLAGTTSRPYLVRNRASKEETKLGLVALTVAARIELADNGFVSLNAAGITLPQDKFAGGTTIILDNDCRGVGPKSARKRAGDPYGPTVPGSDFHLYYHVVEDAGDGVTEYEVDVYDVPWVKNPKRGRVNCYAVKASDPTALLPI